MASAYRSPKDKGLKERNRRSVFELTTPSAERCAYVRGVGVNLGSDAPLHLHVGQHRIEIQTPIAPKMVEQLQPLGLLVDQRALSPGKSQ